MSRNIVLRIATLAPLSLLLGCPTGTLLLGEDVAGPGGSTDCPDGDGDGVTTCDADCDDADPNNFPGNAEVCDGADNDCDGLGDAGGVDFVAKGTYDNEILIWQLIGGDLVGPIEVSPGVEGLSYWPVVGDFTGDGLLDMVVERFEDFPDPESIVIDMYEGDCEGGLTRVGEAEGLEVFDGVDIHTSTDIDGDGRVDVVGWDYGSGDGIVWFGNGDGTFSGGRETFELRWWSPFDGGDRREWLSLPMNDVDGDGIVDLSECTNINSGQTRCQISLGDGAGGFEPVSDFVLDLLMNGGSFADFNGDGEVDILGGLDDDGDSGAAYIFFLEDILEERDVIDAGEAFDVNPADENSQNAPGYGWAYTLDVDYDGDLDVITVTMNPLLEGPMDLHLVRNDGNGGFDAPELFGESTHPLVDFSMWVQDEIAVPHHAFGAN